MPADPGLFVPAFPTLRPESLLGSGSARERHPFCSPTVRYFYFARNAIWHAAKALRLDRGEVLAPAYHHGVEVEALIDAGAAVRFYRTGARFEVDLEDVERKIGPRTSALYLTHYAGFPGPVAAMKRLAQQHGLPLLEDCALALFSADGDLALGVTGDVAVFSLYKVMAVPDGGALVVNGDAAKCRLLPALGPPGLARTLGAASASLLRNTALRGGGPARALRRWVIGMGKQALAASNAERDLTGTQHFERVHVNLGISGLTRRLLGRQDVPAIVETRRRNYLFLLDELRDVSPPLFDSLPGGVAPLFYPLIVDDNKRVMERLVARGIEAVDFWREGHHSCAAADFPDVARLRTSVVEIPCHQDLTLDTMSRVAGAIRGVLSLEPRRCARAFMGSEGPPVRVPVAS